MLNFFGFLQKNVANLEGFIESSCLLLTTLAESYDINMSKRLENIDILFPSSFLPFIFIIFSTTVIASLLRHILLCRPGIGSLEKISKFLEQISHRLKTSEFLDALCLHKNTYDISEAHRSIKYTTDSCPLQTYALVIRLYILPHEKRKFSIKQLTAIVQSTLLFMRNSSLKLPKWLAMEKRGGCLCRARLFGATVTLLYVYLLYWIEHPNEIGNFLHC